MCTSHGPLAVVGLLFLLAMQTNLPPAQQPLCGTTDRQNQDTRHIGKLVPLFTQRLHIHLNANFKIFIIPVVMDRLSVQSLTRDKPLLGEVMWTWCLDGGSFFSSDWLVTTSDIAASSAWTRSAAFTSAASSTLFSTCQHIIHLTLVTTKHSRHIF